MKYDVIVIGSGMSGLMAAAKAVSRNKSTLIITKGQGILPLTTGCIDFWGYQPDNPRVPVSNPYEVISKLALHKPEHPYTKVLDVLTESVDFLKEILLSSGCILAGSIDENQTILTALGTQRITALAPPSMIIKKPQQIKHIIAVGFKKYIDFFPQMFLDNLSGVFSPEVEKHRLLIDLGIKETLRSNHLSLLLKKEEVITQVIDQIKTMLREKGIKTEGEAVGNAEKISSVLVVFPAILEGISDHDTYQRLSQSLPAQVIEVPGLPPSMNGQRLHKALTFHLRQQGTEFRYNTEVTGFTRENGRIASVLMKDSSDTTYNLEAQSIILATGSFIGGGLIAQKHSLLEPIFKLPVIKPKGQDDEAHFISMEGQEFLNAGVEVDEQLRPLKDVNNLYAVGSILAHHNYAAEKSGLGLALTTGYKAGCLA